MKPWDIYTWNFPGGAAERVEQKPMVNVLLCSSQKANRAPKATDVILNHADCLDWATLCKCDFVYSVPAHQLSQKRVVVTTTRRPEIALRIICGLGLAGL
jgi:hypothetical protein